MNDQPYLIPSMAISFKEEIKKSLFITYLANTPDIPHAKQYIAQIKQQHHDARHHCWAFVAGNPSNSMVLGFSDDGEPSGTAGKPILAQLMGSGIGEITAVVVRYFGGTKLGTGGLVKAYGGGVQQALTQLPTEIRKITQKLYLTLDYSLMSIVSTLMVQYDALQVHIDFNEQINMIIEVETRLVAQFTLAIINKSGAKIIVKELTDL